MKTGLINAIALLIAFFAGCCTLLTAASYVRSIQVFRDSAPDPTPRESWGTLYYEIYAMSRGWIYLQCDAYEVSGPRPPGAKGNLTAINNMPPPGTRWLIDSPVSYRPKEHRELAFDYTYSQNLRMINRHEIKQPPLAWSDSHIMLRIPAWPGILLLDFLAAWIAYRHVVRVRKRRRIHDGLCANCGYDLRATPLRCPECGTIPANPLNPPPLYPSHPPG